MRLVTYTRDGAPRPGVLWDDAHVLDLPATLDEIGGSLLSATSVRQVLAAGPEKLRALADALTTFNPSAQPGTKGSALVPLEQAGLRAPLGEDVLVACGGRNYHEHAREMRNSRPERPEGFIKSPSAVVGPNDPIVLPASQGEMVDFEGEIAVVFGQPCYGVSEAVAMDYVAGYTVIDDVSARDAIPVLQKATDLRESWDALHSNQLGKQFPSFCPMGPVVATRDEVETDGGIRLQTHLNDELMQDATTADLVFSTEEMITYFSRFYAFRAGDLLTLGTPSGVGLAQDPPRFLRPGDEVAVTVSGVGTIRNRVVAAAG